MFLIVWQLFPKSILIMFFSWDLKYNCSEWQTWQLKTTPMVPRPSHASVLRIPLWVEMGKVLFCLDKVAKWEKTNLQSSIDGMTYGFRKPRDGPTLLLAISIWVKSETGVHSSIISIKYLMNQCNIGYTFFVWIYYHYEWWKFSTFVVNHFTLIEPPSSLPLLFTSS